MFNEISEVESKLQEATHQLGVEREQRIKKLNLIRRIVDMSPGVVDVTMVFVDGFKTTEGDDYA